MNYIDQIVNYIIRPARDIYKSKRLGNTNFYVYSQNEEPIQVFREDRAILNKQNETIHLSYYECRVNKQNVNEDQGPSTYHSNIFQYKSNQLVDQFNARKNQKNCVVYLHANNGSRIQGMTYLKKILQARLNVCLFDCSGSGISQGQYVTLGLKQSKDLQCVINYLAKQKGITQIALWGRSMGASTALIYASKEKSLIKSLILDSPFKDLQKLIKQIAADRTGLPKIFFNPIIPFIRNQIRSKTGYSIEDLKMKKYLKATKGVVVSENKQNNNPLSQIPALFLVSKNDKLVKVHHGQKLFKRYPCSDKLIEYIQNQHHQNRKAQIIQKCIHFIMRCFRNDQLRNLSEMSSTATKFLPKDIPILNFRKQLNQNGKTDYKQQGYKQKTDRTNNNYTCSSQSKRDNILKKQWNQNSYSQENYVNQQGQKQILYDNNKMTISQQKFYQNMKKGLKNLCEPIENCQRQKYIEPFQQEKKLMRNSSSMSNLINQQDDYNKINPIKLSFVKKQKSKTSYVQNTDPKTENIHYINSISNNKNLISPQRNLIHQYHSNDPIRQKQQKNSQSRGKKISMSRQGSRLKRLNIINQQSPMIPQQKIQLQSNYISVDNSRKIPFIWSYQEQNKDNLSNFSKQSKNNFINQFLIKNQPFNTDRQNTNNFNSKNSFHQQSSKAYNNINLPPPPPSMKVIQFQKDQNSHNYKKKISLSTTLQNIQISSSILEKSSQIQTRQIQRQKQGRYIKTDNYQKNYQSMMNNFSPKRFFK